MKPTLMVRVADLAFLYEGVKVASMAGFAQEDTALTQREIERALDRVLSIDKSVVESALWSQNMLDEAGKFSHPDGLSFRRWLAKAFPTFKFNPLYNTLEDPPHG